NLLVPELVGQRMQRQARVQDGPGATIANASGSRAQWPISSATTSGSAATRSCPRRPANSAAASSTLSTSRVIGRAPSCVTRLANWLRLVITTRQVELPGSRGRTWFAVAGVVQHHQHLSVGQQAAI